MKKKSGFLAALAARGVTVLIGDPDRAYLPSGLNRVALYDVPVPRSLEAADVKPTTIWRVRGPDMPAGYKVVVAGVEDNVVLRVEQA